MQILSSGSFVNLDNKEKIEHLIFTAKEMGRAANETDGFVNEPENNRRLALEIWQGAEYMTRDHEEAQIKNIFVSNFLDCLREIGGAAKPAEAVSENTAGENEKLSAEGETEPPKDEFLGLVLTEEVEEKTVDEPSAAIEPQESQRIENAVSEQFDSVAVVETDAAEIVESEKESTAAIGKQATTEEIETDEPEDENAVGEKQTDNISAKVPGAIVLPEKEPYRWEKCTVTATIQLLPTTDDSDPSAAKRKAVLSVRTHDFAPQFAIVELGDANFFGELLPALEQSFERYKTDLPLKVMDKMKREKSAPKKQANKTTVAAQTSAAKTPASVSQPKPDKSQTEKVIAKPESAKPAAATTFAPKPTIVVPAESGQQGSLFGF